MAEKKFTPGPWVMEFTGPHAATRDGFWEIAPLGPDGEPDWSREIAATADDNKANARLIAAAPEMYEALSECCRIIDAAGLLNLSRGVQLGATSWYVKASDCFNAARELLQRIDVDGGTVESDPDCTTKASTESPALRTAPPVVRGHE